MNTAIAKFMGIAITAVVIIALVFNVAYTMLEGETTEYRTQIEGLQTPSTANPTTR
jgi:succinate dehydrogenase hydrophobic anchor subunit